VAAYHVVWECVVEQWLGVSHMLSYKRLQSLISNKRLQSLISNKRLQSLITQHTTHT